MVSAYSVLISTMLSCNNVVCKLQDTLCYRCPSVIANRKKTYNYDDENPRVLC